MMGEVNELLDNPVSGVGCGCSCQPHVMGLLQDLDLATYNQYTHGKKLVQIGEDAKIRSFTGDIPTLSWLALIDLHFFLVKVLAQSGRRPPSLWTRAHSVECYGDVVPVRMQIFVW